MVNHVPRWTLSPKRETVEKMSRNRRLVNFRPIFAIFVPISFTSLVLGGAPHVPCLGKIPHDQTSAFRQRVWNGLVNSSVFTILSVSKDPICSRIFSYSDSVWYIHRYLNTVAPKKIMVQWEGKKGAAAWWGQVLLFGTVFVWLRLKLWKEDNIDQELSITSVVEDPFSLHCPRVIGDLCSANILSNCSDLYITNLPQKLQSQADS